MGNRAKGVVPGLLGIALLLVVGLFAYLRRGSPTESPAKVDVNTSADLGKVRSPDPSMPAESAVEPQVGTKTSIPSDKEIESWIQGLPLRHAKARAAHSTSRLTGFASAKLLYYREARLAALAFPEAVERKALAVALDANADWVERVFAVSMLHNLNKAGRRDANAALLTLANDSDPRVIEVALGALGTADREGLNRGLYWDRCQKGSLTAYLIVSRYSDAETARLLREIAVTGRSFYAEEALQRVELLQSADWEQKLGSMLKSSQNSLDPAASQWALDMVERKKTPYLLQVLRDRLDESFANASESWKRGTLGVASTTFESEMTKSTDFANLTGDPIYDQTLVIYSQLGGKLSELETARLREFGFLCDPKQRLAELIREAP